MTNHAEKAIKTINEAIEEYAIASDPLRQKLGPTAIEAIMAGNAAVVPLHRVSKKGVPRTLVRLTYLDDAADDLQIFRSVVPIAHARIDRQVITTKEGATT